MIKPKHWLAGLSVLVLVFGVSLALYAEDNKDDAKSGQVDELGDGNSGQGDDLNQKEKAKAKAEWLKLREGQPEEFQAQMRTRLKELREDDPEHFQQTMKRLRTLRKNQRRFITQHGDTNKDGEVDEAERAALIKRENIVMEKWHKDCAEKGEWSDVADAFDNIWERRRERWSKQREGVDTNADDKKHSRRGLKDRLEDRRDQREDKRDRKEDIKDRREDKRDRAEDRRDRLEDIKDAQHDGGKRDKIEDKRDRKEDIRDRREDKRDRKEDIRDRAEDKRDHKEDIWDAKHGWHDNFFKPRQAKKVHKAQKAKTNKGGGKK